MKTVFFFTKEKKKKRDKLSHNSLAIMLRYTANAAMKLYKLVISALITNNKCNFICIHILILIFFALFRTSIAAAKERNCALVRKK